MNLFETHLVVTDMDRAVAFYSKLGLKRTDFRTSGNTINFFWIGAPGQAMLGLWQASERTPMVKRHFAFGVDLAFLEQSLVWLAERGITPVAAFGKEPSEPVVHAWMPAAAVYFNDPDGNELEFITMLADHPRPELGVVYLSEWRKLNVQEPGRFVQKGEDYAT